MLKGFREFLMRGNAIDLSVGVIVGAAFGAIVDSLSKDIITPIVALFVGEPDFSGIRLGPLGIGTFINSVINFIIKAAALYFLIVVPFMRIAQRFAPAAAGPTPTESYLKEIRDLLSKR